MEGLYVEKDDFLKIEKYANKVAKPSKINERVIPLSLSPVNLSGCGSSGRKECPHSRCRVPEGII